MSQAANFQPGAYQLPADYNLVSTAELVQRNVDPVLVKRYGKQMLNMLSLMGYKKSTNNAIKFEHYEENRIMPKVTASVAATTGGALATFTLTSTTPIQQFAMAQFSPYVASSPTTYIAGVPVRPNDVLELFPSTPATNTGTNQLSVMVVSVNTSAGTFTGYEQNGSNIPTLTDTEMVIKYNQHGEGSGPAEPMNLLHTKYTNQLQIIKEATQITGTLANMILYVHEEKTYKVYGEEAAYVRVENYRELALLLGALYNNTNISNTFKRNPISTTVGLIPTITSSGVLQGYNNASGVGFQVADLKNLAYQLNIQRGSHENVAKLGFNLFTGMNSNLSDFFKAGAISYGFFDGNKEKAVSFDFSGMTMGGYTFHTAILDAFSDLQTLAASGQPYPNEGIVFPAEGAPDSKTGEYMSALRIRYQEGRELMTIPRSMLQIDGTDVFRLDYLATVGLETMGANRFAYILQQ